jgi:hypothetical protein
MEELKLPGLPKPICNDGRAFFDPNHSLAFSTAQLLADRQACIRAALEWAAKAVREQTHPVAEFLYGHSREMAVEWAKEDKYDSQADKADEILAIVASAIRSALPKE